MAVVVDHDLRTRFLWLEITGRCQLECKHCYAESSPAGNHGKMAPADWKRVIDDATAIGVTMVQFIGGEPTLHPGFAELAEYAIQRDLKVEIYSNLIHVKEAWWSLFGHPNVRLATSYYSNSPIQHDTITERRGSYQRTKRNIVRAAERGIPIRVGVIDTGEDQHADKAVAELLALGVTQITTDRVRHFGRASGLRLHDTAELCGSCGIQKAAISASGDVWPCVMSRWMPVGNVLTTPLADILSGEEMARVTAAITRHKSRCSPDSDGNDCSPAETQACRPKYSDSKVDLECNPHKCPPSNCTPDACSPTDGCGPGRTITMRDS